MKISIGLILAGTLVAGVAIADVSNGQGGGHGVTNRDGVGWADLAPIGVAISLQQDREDSGQGNDTPQEFGDSVTPSVSLDFGTGDSTFGGPGN